jgi:hypothetical protein
MPGKVAKTAVVFSFVKMQISSSAVKIIPVSIGVHSIFRKREKENKQTENRDGFFQFLHL